jgi:2-amino-4-hydroxy-6-hydroxymethyldihydropteridine diphosphokinase
MSLVTSNATTALIALGSNLGDSAVLIHRAFERLQELSVKPIHKSSLWETTPVDCPPGAPTFLNAAVSLTPLPEETPESLLAKLQAWEKDFGRRPKIVLNEPRPLDLDLVAFRLEVRTTPRLILPHPRAHLRRFVLQPLGEIAPNFVLPGQALAIKDLLATLPADPTMRRLP